MSLNKLLVFCFFLTFFSCKKELDTADTQLDAFGVMQAVLSLENKSPSYAYTVPNSQTWEKSNFVSDDKKATLGRVLFYDKKLSKDGTVSCATCHQQQFAFADDLPISRGVFDKKGTRNSMALGNFTSFSSFMSLQADGKTSIPLFWDSRTTEVAVQIEEALSNENEMGISLNEARQIVSAQPYYAWLLEEAYGDTIVEKERITDALMHFMATFHSFGSRFDAELAKTNDKHANFEGFTASENLGKSIYIQHCDLCHGSLDSPQFVFEANNGLDSVLTDKGKGAISGNFYDNGTFKVPAMRNIGLTAPYMHDGRFADLDAVIEHYSTGVIRRFGLHGDLLTQVSPGVYEAKHLKLTADEAKALKNFLLTLTDTKMATDSRFSNPFR